MWNSLRLYLETLLLKFLFNGFHRKDFDGLKYFCGYLITLCSIILLLVIYKTGRASKSFVWVWGVTEMVSKPCPSQKVWAPHARTRVPLRRVDCSDPKGGLAFHRMPHCLGKHIGMCF